MEVKIFCKALKNIGIESLIGVPDSTLKEFCDYIQTNGKNEFSHEVVPNEGSAVSMAVGVYLGDGKPACVYMQNSGLGNTVNPITSILNKQVYNIPVLCLIGWRGEPNIKDEPQHKFMGAITNPLLELLEIEYSVISKETTEKELESILEKANTVMKRKEQYAIVIKKDTFSKREPHVYKNEYTLAREEAIGCILEHIKDSDLIVSTTGKISREAYEQSDKIKGHHNNIFLTVGGMGHASMIAYGIAKSKKDKKTYCLDGDGAVLMHMGSLAFIGKNPVPNMVHICLNNEAHESVGGMPTGATEINYSEVAKECGYPNIFTAETKEELISVMKRLEIINELSFIEIKVSIGSRDDLGRPKETSEENKDNFMKNMVVK